MERQAEGSAHPRQVPRRLVRQGQFSADRPVFVIQSSAFHIGSAGFGRLFGHVVMMEVKVALHQEQGQEPAQQPTHGQVRRVKLFPRARNQMQDAHSQHQAGDETGRHLHPCVREPDQQRQPPSEQRGQNNQGAVNCQQHHRRG